MSTNNKPPRKGKIFLLWAILVGNIILWSTLGFWWASHRAAPPSSEESVPALGYAIFMIVIGMFFLVTGLIGYGIVIATHCLTFNFTQPVWRNVKTKLYFANIVVPLAVMLGIGFLASAFLTPILARMGLSAGAARMAPILGTLFVLQVSQIWFLIWAPLETRIISQRLRMLGVSQEQLQSGVYVGLSNPAVKGLKRFGGIEEDVGMLWFGPQHLVYWGDGEQWSVGREQLLEVERKADSGSTTMLSGTQHAILHIRLPDGNQRQIRLHTEGILTMGGKRKAMDELSDRINAWRAAPVAV
jgi:hypothetical protein